MTYRVTKAEILERVEEINQTLAKVAPGADIALHEDYEIWLHYPKGGTKVLIGRQTKDQAARFLYAFLEGITLLGK
jgi:hypothetical protein